MHFIRVSVVHNIGHVDDLSGDLSVGGAVSPGNARQNG